jgi:hypothetical protein
MAYTINEGLLINVEDALAGEYFTDDGTKCNFSTRPGTSNCYIASVPYDDESGRFRDIFFDHLGNNTYEIAHIVTRYS